MQNLAAKKLSGHGPLAMTTKIHSALETNTAPVAEKTHS
jgi:hypothetical protein